MAAQVTKPLVERVLDWTASRPEFEGFTPLRNVEVKGSSKDVIYHVDVLLLRKSRLAFFFRRGLMSGTAVAITIGRGTTPMTGRDVAGVQRMAADVLQAAYRGREKHPIQLWVHVTPQEYDEEARRLAGQMRLAWFGRIDAEGNVEQVL